MLPLQVRVGRSGSRCRIAIGMMIAMSLAILLPLVAAQGGPLWNEQEGDNVNLGAMFAPPPSPAPSGPSQLEQWQHQQSGVAQQQQQQPATTQAILTELAVALLRAATAPQVGQQGMQQGGFQPQQQQQMPQQPYRNLYGPQPPVQQQNPGDVALLQQQNAQQRDTILPLFQKGSSAYGFSVPPADVQAKMRRAQKKPISDVQRFAQISQKADPIARWMKEHPIRPFNLDSTVRAHPNRSIPKPPPQRKFKLRTQHYRKSALEPQQDVKAMEHMQSSNPFGLTEGNAKVDSADDVAAFESPAMLAFSEAEKALKSADESMDPAMMEMKAKAKNSRLANKRLPGRHAPKSEFAQPEPEQAEASADLAKMFKSIMRARKNKHA